MDHVVFWFTTSITVDDDEEEISTKTFSKRKVTEIFNRKDKKCRKRLRDMKISSWRQRNQVPDGKAIFWLSLLDELSCFSQKKHTEKEVNPLNYFRKVFFHYRKFVLYICKSFSIFLICYLALFKLHKRKSFCKLFYKSYILLYRLMSM